MVSSLVEDGIKDGDDDYGDEQPSSEIPAGSTGVGGFDPVAAGDWHGVTYVSPVESPGGGLSGGGFCCRLGV